MTRLRSLLVLIVVGWATVRAEAQDPAEYWRQQMVDLNRALTDPSTNERVRQIWLELVEYSNRQFPVYPAQRFNLGEALPTGAILLDLSIAGNSDVEVTAFWLAHEYGHQVLGHPGLLVSQTGRMLQALGGSAYEDAADRWAARFLKRRSYDVAPILAFLCKMPGGGGLDSHSDGATRAKNVAKAYDTDVDVPCQSDTITRSYPIRARIWSRLEGNAVTMDVSIDGEEVGSLSNLVEAEILDLGEMAAGSHTFTLSDITVYGPYGPVASGYQCVGTLIIQARRTFQLWVHLAPDGSVTCGFR